MINRAVVILISIYQKIVSVVIPPCCRFSPSCSEYARQAFVKYRFFSAFFLTIKRIIKCHPYHPGGYDPLP